MCIRVANVGTHVAGIIGGSTFGVAPHTTLHSIKILDGNGDGTTVDLIRGKKKIIVMTHTYF